MAEPRDFHDARTRRCPMLGHTIAFSYCRSPGSELPCRKIFDCWWESFDVVAFIGEHYSEEDVRKIVEPPKEKMVNLADLIARARRGRDD